MQKISPNRQGYNTIFNKRHGGQLETKVKERLSTNSTRTVQRIERKEIKAGSDLKGWCNPKEGEEEPVFLLHIPDSYLQYFHTLVGFTSQTKAITD